MEILNQRVDSSSYTKRLDALDCVETIGAESKVVHSIPVPQNVAMSIEVRFFVFDTSFTLGAIGTTRGMLLRSLGMPVVVGIDVINTLTNITAPFPTLTFVPNVPNREIDVTITGKAGRTLHWHMELTVSRSV